MCEKRDKKPLYHIHLRRILKNDACRKDSLILQAAANALAEKRLPKGAARYEAELINAAKTCFMQYGGG